MNREDPNRVVEATRDRPELTRFVDEAIREIAGRGTRGGRILDFGCGNGGLVDELVRMGYDAHGCDVLNPRPGEPRRFLEIAASPYRLPYEEGFFDVVVSVTVLEHVRNKEECFREIHRVLKPGGISMHLFPSKWYLPAEPHIRVPLVNHFWPACPRWWLGLWAWLGARNQFQQNLPWREVLELNAVYCRDGICYWPNARYHELSERIFGNCSWPMEFYILHTTGGFARLCRLLPFRGFTGWVSSQLRMGFMVQRKQG